MSNQPVAGNFPGLLKVAFDVHCRSDGYLNVEIV